METYKQTIKKLWSANKGMKNRFRAVILSFSEADVFEDAMLEWDEIISPGELSRLEGSCICSHSIEDEYYLKNRLTGYTITVGSECINKFGTREQKQNINVKNRIIKYEGENAPCGSCGKHKVKSPNETIFCKSCNDEGVKEPTQFMIDCKGQSRKCDSCDEHIFGTMTIDTCHRCVYVNTHRKCINKRCRNKLHYSIVPDLCATCKNIELHYRECQRCTELLIPKEEPKWKVMCVECYKENRFCVENGIIYPHSVYRECIKCEKDISDRPAHHKRFNCYKK